MREIFTRPRYLVAFFVLFVVVLYGFVWLNNIPTIGSFFALSVGVWKKFVFLLSLMTSLSTNYTVFSLITTIVLALLFSCNILLIVRSVRHHRAGRGRFQWGKGLGGFVAGVFGIGCSACGAALLGPIAAVLGVGGVLTVLPLHGQEFAIVGIVLLVLSLWSLSKRLKSGAVATNVCPSEHIVNGH